MTTLADLKVKVDTSEAKSATKDLKDLGSAAKQAGSDVSSGGNAAGKASSGIDNVGTSAHGATRELVVLAREAANGNWSRFGSSLTILAQQLNLLTSAFTPAGLAVLGLAAVFGTLAAAAIIGTKEIDTFNASIASSGNYANLTAQQLNALAVTINGPLGTGLAASKDLLAALNSTGQFTADTLKHVGSAAESYVKNGGDAEVATHLFDGVLKDVTASANNLNDRFHFLNASQLDQIKTMQAAGNSQGAAVVLADAFTASQDRIKVSIDAQITSWMKLKGVLAEVWDEFKQGATPVTATQSLIDKYQAHLDLLNNPNLHKNDRNARDGDAGAYNGMTVDQSKAVDAANIAILKQNQLTSAQNAIYDDQKKKIDQVQTTSANYYDSQTKGITQGIIGLKNMNDELAKAALEYKNAAPGSALANPGNYAALQQSIRTKYAPPKAAADPGIAYDQNLQRQLGTLNQITEVQKAQFEISSGSLKNSAYANSAAGQAKIFADAQLKDDKIHNEGLEDATDLVTKQIAIGKDLTGFRALDAALQDKSNSFASDAVRLEAEKQSAVEKTAYAQQQTNLAGDALDKETIKQNDSIQNQIDLLGKTKDQIDVINTTKALTLSYDQQLEKLNKDATTTDQNRADLLTRYNTDLAAQLQKQQQLKDAQAANNGNIGAGISTGIDDYFTSIQNYNQQAHDLTVKTFEGMSNALTTFVTTGKLSFGSLVSSIIQGLINIEIQSAASGIFKLINIATAAYSASSAAGSTYTPAVTTSGGTDVSLDYAPSKHANGAIINAPTNFAGSNGMNTMAEAGPEAILPLSRGSNGKLGVAIQGGSSGGSNITNVINVTVQGGNTNADTGGAVSKGVLDAMKKISNQQISNSTRPGGLLNQFTQPAF